MKKYGWLAAATAGLALLILAGCGVFKSRLPQVDTVALHREVVEQTVVCSGKVEKASGNTQAVAANGQKVQVRVAVPEGRLKLVAEGQRVRVTGMAFAADGYSGTVSSLDGAAHVTPAGGTVVDAVVTLDSADPSLKCGLSATADICVCLTEGFLLPYSCVREDENGREFVYLLRDARAVKCPLTGGQELAAGLLVTEGIDEGDRLIQNPDDVPADGARVREE